MPENLSNRKSLWKSSAGMLMVLVVFATIVFVCFGDALDYYFAKEDFLSLDIGGANKFAAQVFPHKMIYRPVANYGYFAIGRLLFGLDPQLWHCSNLVLHTLAGFLVYLFISKITSDRYVAFLSGLIYLTNLVNFHPIYWVTCATQTLALIAALAVWLSYLAASKRNSSWMQLLCVILFLIALLTNEVNVVIPVIATAYWWIFLKNCERGRASFRLTVWLWITLACYSIIRILIYLYGPRDTMTHLYDLHVPPEIPRNMVEMLTMIIDPLYLLGNILIRNGMLTELHGLLWNWPVAAFLILMVLVCYTKRGILRDVLRRRKDVLKYVGFCLVWVVVALIPSSYIPIAWPWRANMALVGYAFLLAYCLTKLTNRKAYYGILLAVFILWGRWGMAQIRKYGDAYVQIDRHQQICRNIADDTELFLRMYPETEELMTPSVYSSDEFFVVTFAGQQFRLLLPKHVDYLYSPYQHDKKKFLLVLMYSEEDSHLWLQEIVRPEEG